MTPTTGTALALLVAFVLPGFTVALFQERTFKQAEDLSPLNLLLRVLYHSVWCYVLLAVVAVLFGLDRPWLEALYRKHSGDPAVLVFPAAIAIFVPALLVAGWTLFLHQTGLGAKASAAVGLNSRHQEPTAWDHWFRKGALTHVRVQYADGRSVWGYYGGDSFAAYAKDGRDLYLEAIYFERELPDDPDPDAPRAGPWFGKPKPDCMGAWIRMEDAVAVEFYCLDSDEIRPPLVKRLAAVTVNQLRRGRRNATEAPEASASVASDNGRTDEGGAAEANEQASSCSGPGPAATTVQMTEGSIP